MIQTWIFDRTVLQFVTFVRMHAPLCSRTACRRCDLETAECKKSFTMLNDASLNASRTPHVTRHTWHCTRSWASMTQCQCRPPPTPQTLKCIYLRATARVAVRHLITVGSQHNAFPASLLVTVIGLLLQASENHLLAACFLRRENPCS